MSGFHYSSKTGRTEYHFVEEVVQHVLTKLNRESSSDLKGLVGIERKIEQIELLLCLDSPGVCCVGIWGMGGIGKTTLADAVFHRQRQSSKFEACCFLANVREKSEKTDGLNDLRNTLVRELLKDKDVNINSPSIPPHIQDRLRRTKALIVLDDVNARKQLEYLVGDHDRFCQGSRIIITARDKGLLEQKVDHEKIYNVEGLGSDEALELFHLHAFGNKSPTTDEALQLSREVVEYSKGNPLALKVMGSSFRRCKSKLEWEVQWKKVKQFPEEEIDQVLKISYDGLGKNEKEIFLDMACFHKGYLRNYVEEFVDSCGFFGKTGINDLIDRSLISISEDMELKKLKEKYPGGRIDMQSVERIEMHDLVQEMGREIAREQSSRLFNADDVYQVLINNQRDGRVQAISFDLSKYEKLPLELEHANFEKMYQLRRLRVSHYPLMRARGLRNIVSLDLPNSLRYLVWEGYPLKSLPSKFSAQNLVVLSMQNSQVVGQLWNEDQSPVNLKRINLSECYHLTEVPNLSRSRKIEHIDLKGCHSLVEIPSYFQHLSKLTYLDLTQCTNLKNLPEVPCNLEFLILYSTAIEELHSSVWSHEKISHLDIRFCRHLKSLPSNTCKLKLSSPFSLIGCKSLCEFWELPMDTTVLELSSTTIKELRKTSIEFVVGLTAIKLIDCKSLVSLPTNIWKLKYLESLDLSGCSNFQHFPEISEAMEHLEFLNLSGTTVKEVPRSIGNLVALRKLCLVECSIQEIPDDLFCLTSLQELDLSSTKIKSIPASIKQAAQLSRLCLNGCKSLESLPEFPPLLQSLEADRCTSLKTVISSSTAITQGWEEYIFYRGLHEKHIFSNCPKLDENARSNIMADAQLRIMRMATASSKFKEDKFEKLDENARSNTMADVQFRIMQMATASSKFKEDKFEKGSFVAIRCCGNEIPNWFSHKSEGCSIKIKLPRDWFSTDFLGFAISLVANKRGSALFLVEHFKLLCKYNFKTSNGESHEVNHGLFDLFDIDAIFDSGDPREVFVWWYNNVFEEVVEGAESPTAFYKLVTEVNVDFTVWGLSCTESLPVEKCGICLLYGKDAEMIKADSAHDKQHSDILQVLETDMNSSSSSLPFPAPLEEKYDVFVSFRGEDTRDAFTSHLHAALLRKQIETYIDNRLEKGDDIGPSLKEAIKKSKIAVVIFSKNYASSTWCLKELAHILECKKSYGQIVIPIFYGIDPSHVRKQQGTYVLEDRPLKRNMDEVANWRAALEEAANMSGFPYSSKKGTEADFVEEVLQHVLTKLNRESSSDLRGLVGIERKIEEMESLLWLDSTEVCCVGIWGMGGIGKTTLADAVFHRQSSKFDAACFLANVREISEQTDGLKQLRNTLLGEILKDSFNINTPSIPLHIQDRLRRKKALIVLDDVNARKQLEDLVGDHDRFCQGSRIIITARDKGLLEQKVNHEKIYNVEGLGSDEALQLFHSHAFRNKSSTTDYAGLSKKVIDYSKGNPLALKVMGSLFHRCRSKQEWEDQWNNLKHFSNEEIEEVLRISYDGLGKNEKEIFLDIACFYKGYERNYVKKLLDGCGFRGEKGINDLIDRSLISISNGRWIDLQSKEFIKMHDLVQEMGRAIAREQRSRLFNAEDVYQVLTNNQRDGHVQAISFDLCEIEKLLLELEHANFEKMYQLKCLRVSYGLLKYQLIVSLDLPHSLRYLEWKKYPLKSLPSKFSTQNLVVLEMPFSEVGSQLWTEDQSPVNLKWICLSECKHLTEVPNLSRSLKIEHIDLWGCDSLVEIPLYFQHLGKLTYLDLGSCTNLKNLPQMPGNLEVLLLSDTAIEELPSSVWSHKKISRLDITYCRDLKSLPSNSCKLKLSGSLSLNGCKSLCQFWELPTNTRVLDLSETLFLSSRNLMSLPTNIWKLKSLESLDLSCCSKFQNFPEISEAMEHLEFLNLSGTAVKELPPSIGNLVALRKLALGDCNNLEVVPDDLFCLTSLQELDLSSTKIKSIPASIKQAAQLSRLCLRDCRSLESLPELPPLLQCLEAEGCTSLKTVSSSSTAITQGWEEYIFSRGLREEHIFSDCPKLDENARSNIMADAQLRILRMATSSSKFKEDKIEQASYDSDYFHDESEKEFFGKRSSVAIRCWGYEIPKWFSHQCEGSSIKIELPRDWFSTDFFGFALSFVVGYAAQKIGCKYNFKTSNGESHVVNHPLFYDSQINELTFVYEDSHEVFVWWYNNVFEEVVEEARSPTVFYNHFTEVNVDFNLLNYHREPFPVGDKVGVEKCGICLLYGKDAEMIKQRALYAQDAEVQIFF
ncbi:uncharacterized protein LOC110744265 [Prunus avium]|uniref:ADP-ribosyl cyclase/cyclic ADP-ribose hydrolase n=1 Tax=Prunus avium TaxID=42229 RepID=A0A6P5RAU8_PRUAV|nr:uncharacterized protein LOC110744265 [Prunus avium]